MPIDGLLSAAPGAVLRGMFEPQAKRLAEVFESHRADFELIPTR